jgi:prolipoprotein diacylglyceryl transferase
MHSITWDIDRVLVYLPGLHFPIYWYGLLFALGVFFAQKALSFELKKKFLFNDAQIQNLIFVIIVSIVLGARIFDIIFYQNFSAYLSHPWDLLNLRQGGLSSHGGFVGFLVALRYFSHKYKTSFIDLLSSMTVPAGILACFIRLGNFFNQEILGKAYSGWGSVIFKSPLDGSKIIPRHPVVLYEAFSYIMLALIFKKIHLPPQKKTALALVGYFSARGFLEIFKESKIHHSWPFEMTTGMALSLPIILGGLILFFIKQSSRAH